MPTARWSMRSSPLEYCDDGVVKMKMAFHRTMILLPDDVTANWPTTLPCE